MGVCTPVQGAGTSWLFPFENGAPPVGWHDAGAYLILPALLIISQVVSQKIISPPKSSDPSQQQMQGFLSFLPFLLGKPNLGVVVISCSVLGMQVTGDHA